MKVKIKKSTTNYKAVNFMDLLEMAANHKVQKFNPKTGKNSLERIVKCAAVIIHYNDDTVEFMRSDGFDENNFDFMKERIHDADCKHDDDGNVISHDDDRKAHSIMLDLKTKNKEVKA